MHRIAIPASVREFVYSRDGSSCVYCGNTAQVLDHVVPYSLTMDNSPDNLVACCRKCNGVAIDYIFNGLWQKREFILAVRTGIEVDKTEIPKGRKYRNKCYCMDCKVVYMPRALGSTYLLCPQCAERDRALELDDYPDDAVFAPSVNRRACEECGFSILVYIFMSKRSERWFGKALCESCIKTIRLDPPQP